MQKATHLSGVMVEAVRFDVYSKVFGLPVSTKHPTKEKGWKEAVQGGRAGS